MLKTVRKTRRSFYNIQRSLGTVTMILELFSGQYKRAGKKLANKFIGRHVVRKIFLKWEEKFCNRTLVFIDQQPGIAAIDRFREEPKRAVSRWSCSSSGRNSIFASNRFWGQRKCSQDKNLVHHGYLSVIAIIKKVLHFLYILLHFCRSQFWENPDLLSLSTGCRQKQAPSRAQKTLNLYNI